MRTISTFALIVSSAVLLAACSSTKLDDKANAPVQNGASNGADTRAVGTVNAGSVDPLNDPQGVLAKRSVYFDYDSYTVKPEYRTVIENHAKYLVAHKDRKMIIQGNTDERGGAEYNLALGQKRAEAVRKALVLLGVSDAQWKRFPSARKSPRHWARMKRPTPRTVALTSLPIIDMHTAFKLKWNRGGLAGRHGFPTAYRPCRPV
jgi:peptidoglycan-associated lipoprotein